MIRPAAAHAGNANGLGSTRAHELDRSCNVLGVRMGGLAVGGVYLERLRDAGDVGIISPARFTLER